MRSSAVIFVSAFLLLVLQPMLGKSLLPAWGGAASVWTACLLFFQTGLLLGYLYAFGSAGWLNPRTQARLHLAMLGIAGIWLWLQPAMPIPMLRAMDPAVQIFWELSVRVGFPFVVLASTSPLLSHWSAQLDSRREPYWLYAVSNLGSLLGCLSYPFAIEPMMGLGQQRLFWTCAFTVLIAAWIPLVARYARVEVPSQDAPNRRERPWSQSLGLWIALSSCTSIVLAAATNHISQAGVVVPGLWVIPLALYLTSWWLAFRFPLFGNWYVHSSLYYGGGFLAILLLAAKLWVPWLGLVLGYALVVLFLSLACHGLLYACRPVREQLTAFYLCIAVGGALGTAFVSLIAPHIWSDYFEMQFGLALGACAIATHDLAALWPKLTTDAWVRRLQWPATLVGAILMCISLTMQVMTPGRERVVDQLRDFYGVVRVTDQPKTGIRALVLGQTVHGIEPLDGELDPDRTLYYRSDSGIALAWGWSHANVNQPLHVGLIGLGTGSLSLFARKEDRLIYYEISPAVRTLAERHFHYLSAHQGATDIRIGDGRAQIAQETSDPHQQPLDLVVLDAFANDSLPMHLLTVQAIAQYRARMQPQGLIAFNITNRNLDLAPMLFSAAREVSLQPVLIESRMQPPNGALNLVAGAGEVRWLLMFPPEVVLPAWPGARSELRRTAPAWSDDFASPLQALR